MTEKQVQALSLEQLREIVHKPEGHSLKLRNLAAEALTDKLIEDSANLVVIYESALKPAKSKRAYYGYYPHEKIEKHVTD